MQGARHRRPVAAVTAMLVAMSGALVMLSAAPSVAVTSSVAAPVAASTLNTSSAGSAVGSAVGTSAAQQRSSAQAGTQLVTARRPTPKQRAEAKRRAAAKRKAAAAKRKAVAQRRAAARKKAAAQRAAARKKVAAKRAAAKRAAAKKAAARKARWIARWRKVRLRDPRTWIKFAPGHVTPRGGPRFNNPYGSKVSRRKLLSHVIRTIKATPGYRLPVDRRTGRRMPCPTNPKLYPSEIKIAVYSIADRGFASALIAAHRRCVSVQVLMNSHLTAQTSHSWARIIHTLGKRGRHWKGKRSFARRCTNGCLGTSVLHSKIYLFSSAGRTRFTVITGSSNMTKNAIGIQWNDLFTINRNRTLYSQYRHMFKRMVPDHRAKGPYVFRARPYQSFFYPFRKATKKTDATMKALRTIKCSGARPGSGKRGHTVVYINMHAWFGHRGSYVARKVRDLYRRGCYVRILYSFMSFPTFATLKFGTGPRMVVRRVLFPGPAGIRAAKYSHMKMIAASGNIAGRSPAWVVWTGSNNFTDRSNHADEVTLRIPSMGVYRAYVRHWKKMKHRRSTKYWAMFEEPEGGGRAP